MLNSPFLNSPNLKFLVSLTLLQNRGVDRNEAFAAAGWAAVIPGLVGLALPLIFAGQSTQSRGDERPTLSAMPDVVGASQEDAAEILAGRELRPVSQSFFIKGGTDDDKGKVVEQVPEAGTFVAPGSTVKLIVSRGAAPAPEDDLTIHERSERAVKDTQSKLLAAKEEILEKAAETHETGASTSTKRKGR